MRDKNLLWGVFNCFVLCSILIGCLFLGGCMTTKNTTVQSLDDNGQPVTTTTSSVGWSGDMSEVNELIAKGNSEARTSYGDAMVACGDNAACQVGVSAAYFSNAGRMPFYKPDTPLDWFKAGGAYLPYLGMLTAGGNTHGSNSPSIKGDGNIVYTVSGSADHTIFSPNFTKTIQTQLSQNGGTPTIFGTQPNQDPVIVQPSYPPTEVTP